jgi:signal transduction histidine kinase
MAEENYQEEYRRKLEEVARFPDMNPGPVLRLDFDGCVLLSNAAAQNLFGQDLQGKNWKNICPNIALQTWTAILSSLVIFPVEASVGDRRFVFNHRTDAVSKLVFVFGSDVTELRNAEKQAREIARFPDMNPGPVLRLDFDGCVLLSNAAAQNLFGVDLHGKNWKTICPNIDAQNWSAIISSTALFPIESNIGEKFFLFNHRTDFVSKLVFVFGSDITELRTAEKKVREIARFPDMNPGPVIRLNTEGIVLLDNASAQKLFGHDIKGNCWLDIWPALRGDTWNKIISSESVIPFEVRIDKSDFVFNHRMDLLTELVFVYGTDITIQKNAERKLAQTEKMATLGTLAAGIAHELNNPAAAAGSAALQLKDLIRKSEQWRNKMVLPFGEKENELVPDLLSRSVLRSADKVKKSLLELSEMENEIEDWLIENKTEDAHEYAASIISLGYSLKELRELSSHYDREFFFHALLSAVYRYQINALLDELKESSGRISEIVRAMKSYSFLDQAAVQEVDVQEGIDNTLIILRNKLKEGVHVNFEYGKIPKITAYGSELNQVWTNIIDNAIGAMKGKGEITIRTKAEDNFVIVEIEDNGPGIPKEIQSRIFDPFFTTKEPGKGTGLGLSTTYGIITEKHNGTINVQSQPGKTTFIVTLPVNGVS